MGAHPKKKLPQKESNRTHSAWVRKIAKGFNNIAVSLVTCSHCGATKQAHRACNKCGYYRGKLVGRPKTQISKVA